MNAYQISYEADYATIATSADPEPKMTRITLTEVVIAENPTRAMKKLKEDYNVEEKDITIIHKLNKK